MLQVQRPPNCSTLIILIMIYLATSSTPHANATKCYNCEFNSASCLNPLNCYNQPDTCSNTNFSPLSSQVIDCESGCQQHVITDATGKIVVWRRNCAPEEAPRAGHNCMSQMWYFFRYEQCWCHTDLCNSASTIFKLKFFNLASLASISVSIAITFMY